jgi:hypothetical protein
VYPKYRRESAGEITILKTGRSITFLKPDDTHNTQNKFLKPDDRSVSVAATKCHFCAPQGRLLVSNPLLESD